MFRLMSRAHRMALGAGFVSLAALVAVACSDSGNGDSGFADAGGFANDGATTFPTTGGDSATADARPSGASDAGPTEDASRGEPDAGDAVDAASPDPVDAADSAPLACAVRFTVTAAALDDAGVDAGSDGLYVVGGAIELGSWQPPAAVPLAQKGPATWSGAVTFLDGAALEFKFIKRGASTVTWEDWGLYSNRSMVVRCPTGSSVADAAIDAPVDAAPDAPIDASADASPRDADLTDAGPLDAAVTDAGPPDASDAADAGAPVHTPVVGDDYAGTFNVKPADAT
jgi:hypothetical protein